MHAVTHAPMTLDTNDDAPALAARARPRRALVADDDPDIREIVAWDLETMGYQVVQAANGDEAFDMARQAALDLIVLDVMMPGRDGLDVLADLRTYPHTATVPVVILTARANDADVWAGWRAGATYYLTKPFDVEELNRFVLSLDDEPTP